MTEENTAMLWTREGTRSRLEGVVSHGVLFSQFVDWTLRRAAACPCEACIGLMRDATTIFAASLLATKAPVTPYEAECAEIVLMSKGGPAPNGD